MPVIYNKAHQIAFISGTPSSYTVKRSWDDFHLIPEKAFSTPIFEPKYILMDKPFSSRVLDYTQFITHGLTFESASGEWTFYVDHDRWSSWSYAKRTIENFINGKRLYCVFSDYPNYMYFGRFRISSWEDGETYSKISIYYDIDAENPVSSNAFYWEWDPFKFAETSTAADTVPTHS